MVVYTFSIVYTNSVGYGIAYLQSMGITRALFAG